MMPINIGSTQPGASMAHPMLAAALSGLDPPEQENMTVSTCFPNFMMI
jgi:hypothetical protein